MFRKNTTLYFSYKNICRKYDTQLFKSNENETKSQKEAPNFNISKFFIITLAYSSIYPHNQIYLNHQPNNPYLYLQQIKYCEKENLYDKAYPYFF